MRFVSDKRVLVCSGCGKRTELLEGSDERRYFASKSWLPTAFKCECGNGTVLHEVEE